MRILCAIVEPTADLVPLGRNTDLVHRRRICPKPIGDDAARSPVFLHDPLEKVQRCGFVSLLRSHRFQDLALMVGAVAGLVGIEGGVVSGVFNLKSSGVEAPDWRPRHDEHYHEA